MYGLQLRSRKSNCLGGAPGAVTALWNARIGRRLVKQLAGFLFILGLYAGLVVGLTWPLFKSPWDTVYGGLRGITAGKDLWEPDIYFTIWVLSWGWRALLSNPSRLYDANIFHPAHLTLTGSEHMLGHLPIFGPVFAVTGNPVLAHQLNMLLALSLCGTSMYLLLRHWGCWAPAAFFGGLVFALFPGRHLWHSHLLAFQYLPLAVLFFDRSLRSGKWSHAFWSASFFLWQLLCSYYVAYITAVTFGSYAVWVGLTSRDRASLPAYRRLAATFLGALLIFGLVSGPYLVATMQGRIPYYGGTGWILVASNHLWQNYFIPPTWLESGRWRLPSGTCYYLGFVPIALVAVALAWCFRAPVHVRRVVGGLTICSAVAYLFSLGPTFQALGTELPGPYAIAQKLVPGFASMRVPSRFGLGVIFGVAALAGIGAAQLQRFARGLRELCISVLFVGVVWEYGFLSRSLTVETIQVGEKLPVIYRVLAALPQGPVLEIPAPSGGLSTIKMEAQRTFFSIFHRKPILNGYSGYRPPSYWLVMNLANALPQPRALELLQRSTGLKYVLVDLNTLDDAQRQMWADPPGLKKLREADGRLLFETLDTQATDLIPRLLRNLSSDETIEGTRLAPIPVDDQVARLRLIRPASNWSGLETRVGLEITNESTVTWPVFTAESPYRVVLMARWEFPGTVKKPVEMVLKRGGLPYDLRPGEVIRLSVTVPVPRWEGTADLYIGVVQNGSWFRDKLGPIRGQIRPFWRLSSPQRQSMSYRKGH